MTGEKTPEGIADFYLEKGVSFVAVKLGKEGAYFRSKESEGYTEGCRVDQVVDTVGAGDGFAVGVISGILDGLPYKDAVQRGMRSAHCKFRHRGTWTVCRQGKN